MDTLPADEYTDVHGRRVRGYILDRHEFNRLCAALPRSVRSGVATASDGHVGLVAHAFAEDGDLPLAASYEVSLPGAADVALRSLMSRLAESLA